MRIGLVIIVTVVACFYPPSSRSDSGEDQVVLLRWETFIHTRAVENCSPAFLHQVAHYVPLGRLIDVVYGGKRTASLVAVDALGYIEDPWTVMPFVVALMKARDREIAARSARSFLMLLKNAIRGQNGVADQEIVTGQVEQLVRDLASIVSDIRLDVDVRIAAIEGLSFLRAHGFNAKRDFLDLLSDADPAVRKAALALVFLPLDDEELIKLAQVARRQDDLVLAGQAAGLLCENAQMHGVKAPSKDLSDILRPLLGRAEASSDALSPIAACLKRFPSAARIDLVDMIMHHPDPGVVSFWKNLKD